MRLSCTHFIHSLVFRTVTLFNTVSHLCTLCVSNLEAVIGQFSQDIYVCPNVLDKGQ